MNPKDLLRLADEIAELRKQGPRQANLRRAISTAYYALFHLLCRDAAAAVVGKELATSFTRGFAHTTMKETCSLFAQAPRWSPLSLPWPPNVTQHPLSRLHPAVEADIEEELRRVARSFVALQEERHKADYDPFATFRVQNTQQLIQQAQGAFTDWESLPANSRWRSAFCLLLLVGKDALKQR